MAYNKGRFTISKCDCNCDHCGKPIKKNEAIYIIPGRLIVHKHCKNGNQKEKRYSSVSRSIGNS